MTNYEKMEKYGKWSLRTFNIAIVFIIVGCLVIIFHGTGPIYFATWGAWLVCMAIGFALYFKSNDYFLKILKEHIDDADRMLDIIEGKVNKEDG